MTELFKKVLFPTDFSENSDRVLAHAIRLTNFHDGELIVQHVVRSDLEKSPHWSTAFNMHGLQCQLDAFAASEMARIVREAPPDIRVRPVISKGRVPDEIAELAEKELVDLIVMGSVVGGTTLRVVRMTSRPVLALSSSFRHSNGTGIPRRILIATDFSEHSKRVVQFAFRLRKAFNASIYLLHVIETTRAVEYALEQGFYGNPRERMKEWALNQLLNLVPDESLEDSGIVRMVEFGRVSSLISSISQEIDADLTVLGAHDSGGVSGHLIGPTTEATLATLQSPLLTVRV